MNKIPHTRLTLFALCFVCFIVIIDATIINVALPAIAQDLQGCTADLQWIVAGYALTFACFLLTAGSLGDCVGSKKTVIAGLVLFLLSSLGCALASNFIVLTLSRLAQGIGAALLLPNSLSLIHAIYETPGDKAKAFGIWAGVGGIAAASGPILGAILTTWFGWRAIFFINIPIGVFGLGLIIYYVSSSKPRMQELQYLDIRGPLCSVVSVAALALALIEANRFGWGSIFVLGCLITFAVALILFWYIEKKTVSPMLPLHFFKSHTFSIAIFVGMILNMGIYGQLFILPLYFQKIRGYSILATGLAILPMTGVSVIGSYLSGKITADTGPKQQIRIGLVLAIIGFSSLVLFTIYESPYWTFVLPLILIGFGISFAMPATTIAAVFSVPESHVGVASGVLSMLRQIGSLLGVAIFGTIMSAYPFIQGMNVTLIAASIIFLCGSLAVSALKPGLINESLRDNF